jgi:pimeloyl-ACP methyl ester carboxylesterase
MHENGVGTLHNMHSVITGIFFPTLKMTDFTQKERLSIWRGKSFVSKAEVSSGNFKAADVTTQLDIPFYVLAGRYDMTTDYELQKEYFQLVKTDIKGFYSFENSAHSPLFEEHDKAKKILAEDVLNGKTDLADSF